VHVAIGAVIGLCIGGALPWSQRGGEPTTHPAEPVRALADAAPASLPSWARMAGGEIAFDAGSLHVELEPRLRFYSRSPDRGWTAFAGADRAGAPEPAAVRV